MELHRRLGTNVEMLEVPIEGRDSVVNLTLAWDKTHLVLMDTGFPGQTDEIVKAISSAGFDVKNLTDIFLTHQDIDHIGCCLDLMKLAPAAKVYAHEAEAPYIDGTKTPVKLADMEANLAHLDEGQKGFYEMLKSGFANRKIPIDKTLVDHEVLPFCGGIEVVHTPGHTPGHMCLYLKESRIMVCGDAANVSEGKLVGPNPAMTADMGEGMSSLDKILSYDLSGAICYHTGYLEMEKR